MKKRLGIIILTALFLTFTVLLASCDNAGDADKNKDTTDPSNQTSETTDTTKDSEKPADSTEPTDQTEDPAGDPVDPEDPSDELEIDNSETQIGVLEQEYIGDNIAEILWITYDGDQDALKEFNGKNPEIEMLNNSIKNGVLKTYNDFMANYDAENGGGIEIKSYPFTDGKWVQIVITYFEYPIYGTDGTLESYNFNKTKNYYMTVDDAMAELELTKETISDKVKELWEPEMETMSITEVEPKGFLIKQGVNGPYTMFLLEVTIDNTESEPWTSFYAYIPQFDEFSQLNAPCLFDPYDMDGMDVIYGVNEPLFYMQARE